MFLREQKSLHVHIKLGPGGAVVWNPAEAFWAALAGVAWPDRCVGFWNQALQGSTRERPQPLGLIMPLFCELIFGHYAS